MNQVTPGLESIPERSYIQVDKRIRCFKVLTSCWDCSSTKITLSDKPIYQLDLPTEEAARTLMDDLYYGEYTGG
jgi:hypothetical protein